MRRILIGLVLGLGAIPWALGVSLVGVSGWFARVLSHLDPAHKFGNCWTYALPRYQERGGYLLIRPSRGVKFLSLFLIPHVSWVRELGDGVDLEQFEPVSRRGGKWFPWYVLWYHGVVTTKERKSGRVKVKGVGE